MILRILIGALLLAILAAGVQTLRLKALETEIDGYKVAVDRFEQTQITNLDTISVLQDANAAWKRQFAVKKADASAAAEQVGVLSAQLDAQSGKNRELRNELARKDAAVAAYLRAGMPASLACQLWPSSC